MSPHCYCGRKPKGGKRQKRDAKLCVFFSVGRSELNVSIWSFENLSCLARRNLAYAADPTMRHRIQIVRHQYNFSPPDTTTEREDYSEDLDSVTNLELLIIPDISGGHAQAFATAHGRIPLHKRTLELMSEDYRALVPHRRRLKLSTIVHLPTGFDLFRILIIAWHPGCSAE